MGKRRRFGCAEIGCDGKHVALGYCKRHYNQLRSTGSPTIRRPNPRGTPEERFWRHVKVGTPDECWYWTGYPDKDGYGALRITSYGSPIRAHRFSYEIHFGAIPEGLLVRHRCNNPPCVNPMHLVVGTVIDNARDAMDAGRVRVGESHPNAKFSSAVVSAVRETTGTYPEIGARFGISVSQVGNIRRGQQRKTG